MKLAGIEAIEYAEANDLTLNKYTDPTEEARMGLTPAEARKVASEDPSLIWIEERTEEVQAFVDANDDDDDIDDSELERVFCLAYGRPADDEDRQTGLWSLICAAVAR